MNLGIRESVALARGVLHALRGKEETPEVILCASFTALSEVRKVLARSRVHLGAQNCGIGRSGAFTGDVSVAQLEDVSCAYVIVGHSERRHLLGESDDVVRQKVATAMESKLTPIICVGESMAEREAGREKSFVQGQVASALDGLVLPRGKKLILAYEPVWAIGSGNPASVQDAISMHEFIRAEALCHVKADPEDVVVLYGGSVTDENAYGFLREDQIDGLLIGGASLKPHEFGGILTSGVEVMVAQN